ncbi:MAG: hypothetical protein ACK55A_10505 [Gemmatimonas sp.]
MRRWVDCVAKGPPSSSDCRRAISEWATASWCPCAWIACAPIRCWSGTACVSSCSTSPRCRWPASCDRNWRRTSTRTWHDSSVMRVSGPACSRGCPCWGPSCARASIMPHRTVL